ncbi:chemotaxis sensory transducer protein [Alicycliphilus sp. B1]|nr:chemotaxis sensory transducer protein [Alicycliphilus sp. B1]
MCDIMELRMQLSNIKVGTRLALSFGLVLFITALIAGIGIWRLQALAATTQQLTSTDNERLKAAQQWRQASTRTGSARAPALLDSGTSHLASWQAEMDQTSKDVDVSRKVVERLLQSDEGRELLADIGQGPRGLPLATRRPVQAQGRGRGRRAPGGQPAQAPVRCLHPCPSRIGGAPAGAVRAHP